MMRVVSLLLFGLLKATHVYVVPKSMATRKSGPARGVSDARSTGCGACKVGEPGILVRKAGGEEPPKRVLPRGRRGVFQAPVRAISDVACCVYAIWKRGCPENFTCARNEE